jgi:acetyl esterase/lipase
MSRTLTHSLLWSALLSLCFAAFRPAAAEMPPTAYGAVVLQARVLDRLGRPISHLPLHFAADLNGVALRDNGQSEGVMTGAARTVRTDAAGLATWRVSGLPWTHESRWFRGHVALTATLPQDVGREIAPLGGDAATETLELPQAAPAAPLALQIYEEPDKTIGGFPVWAAHNGQTDKVVVVLEGFDLYNRISATGLMTLLSPASDALRERGVSVLVVHFPDSHLTPDKLAPRAVEAIQAAAQASGHSVAVVGLSAGGIIARYALVEAEECGTPLPVNTFLSMDCPNRGARMNPQLQAIVMRYGTPSDKAALASDAARVLLTDHPVEVQWKWVGLPLAGRAMPVAFRDDTSAHDAFYNRLHHLNDRNGYPKRCRLVGVASGSRRGEAPAGRLLTLWVPYTYGWTLPAAAEDRTPGSVLPPYYVGRFTTVYPLGVAGATLRTAPTFIPTSSALDAGPDETPPFDAWYALPDNSPPIAHDSVAPDEARFVVGALLASDWKQ